eukprot:scaffold3878_cov363-Prasinococcus_capsulatus_cf.AAC.1
MRHESGYHRARFWASGLGRGAPPGGGEAPYLTKESLGGNPRLHASTFASCPSCAPGPRCRCCQGDKRERLGAARGRLGGWVEGRVRRAGVTAATARGEGWLAKKKLQPPASSSAAELDRHPPPRLRPRPPPAASLACCECAPSRCVCVFAGRGATRALCGAPASSWPREQL